MALRRTVQPRHGVYLTDPLKYERPKAVEGCRVCGAIQREINRVSDRHSKDYNPSKAADLRVEMRRHHLGEEAK